MICLQYKSDHATSLLRRFLWLLVAIRINADFSICLTKPVLTWFLLCPLAVSLDTAPLPAPYSFDLPLPLIFRLRYVLICAGFYPCLECFLFLRFLPHYYLFEMKPFSYSSLSLGRIYSQKFFFTPPFSPHPR